MLTPKMEIALPDLNHNEFNCALEDISPIKVVHRAAVEAKVNADMPQNKSEEYSPRSRSQAMKTYPVSQHFADPNRRQHNPRPPRGINVTGDYSFQYGQDSIYQGQSQNHFSNPYYVIRCYRRAFASCAYLLPCLRENDLVSVNLSRYGHIRHCQDPEVSFLLDLLILY
jgi:hypothetical protein